jgi:hypothetical protein
MFRTAILLASLVASAAPAAAQERQWSLEAGDEEALLYFGVPDTDDVGISFWCRRGGKEVQILSPLTSKTDKSTVTLQLEGTRKDLTSKHVEEAGRLTLEATVPADLLPTLQAADRFTLTINGHTVTYPLITADFESFTKTCQTR